MYQSWIKNKTWHGFCPILSPLITDEIVILASYLDPQSLKFLFIAMNILIVGLFWKNKLPFLWVQDIAQEVREFSHDWISV